MWFPLRPALLILLLALGQQASALEVGGVNFAPQIEVDGSKLELNGAGVRYKAIFKVYAAGLYVSRKADSLEEILKAPGPKRMSITMLRDIDASELGKLFSRGIEDNMDRAAFVQLIPGIMRMSQIFSDHKRLVAGDSFSLDWIPGQGLSIAVKGKVQGAPFKEPEFFAALLGIWLGKAPADWQLKNALLDIKP
ncbi:MAG: chalcone isomerase family protein [Burkholderiales bacterium]|nr:chalcone isomerase family protein [Burkholderiales bacterium]